MTIVESLIETHNKHSGVSMRLGRDKRQLTVKVDPLGWVLWIPLTLVFWGVFMSWLPYFFDGLDSGFEAPGSILVNIAKYGGMVIAFLLGLIFINRGVLGTAWGAKYVIDQSEARCHRAGGDWREPTGNYLMIAVYSVARRQIQKRFTDPVEVLYYHLTLIHREGSWRDIPLARFRSRADAMEVAERAALMINLPAKECMDLDDARSHRPEQGRAQSSALAPAREISDRPTKGRDGDSAATKSAPAPLSGTEKKRRWLKFRRKK